MAETLVSGAVGSMTSYAAFPQPSSFMTGKARCRSGAKMGRMVADGMARRKCVVTLAQEVAGPRGKQCNSMS